MEKKISFGFNKISKKSNLLPNKTESKDERKGIELIKCLEGQTIQLIEKKEEEAPLIIKLKDGGRTSAALLSLRTRQAVLNGEEIVVNENESKTVVLPPPELNENGIEDIEKRAARELLTEINQNNETNNIESTLVLPIKAEDLPLDGAKESTIDDYESIPITQFGKAMLRGMGWKDQPKKKGDLIDEGPVLRPKGMGLGADKALKRKALLVPPETNEILEIKKGACVLVLGGKNKDLYGQVEGLDEHAGRVIVRMALGGAKESFNEFMVQPVSKKEYSQYSKCINSAKYDEYKRMENEYGQIKPKKENLKNEDDEKQSERNHQFKVENQDKIQKYNSHLKDDDKVNPSSHRYSSDLDYSSRKRRHDEGDAKCSTSGSKDSNRRSRRSPSNHRSKSIETVYSSDESSPRRSKDKKKPKKSKKSKKSKDKKHEKRYSSDSSSNDHRRHKKKTNKDKRRRSRSRSKVRR
ncbi:G-patch domain and KOW motifs-containing protein [Eupeodes corollae]|uniref:G-patch domain and KOW motifs-containing protein n=1 Tax=Eupeodes corollae TaxID=290404 RepID=UPI00249181A3|nr:G-patch domain and KOW motifs-containing protein [Eupeodes corollae]